MRWEDTAKNAEDAKNRTVRDILYPGLLFRDVHVEADTVPYRRFLAEDALAGDFF